jgi:hypothetical protein
MFGTYADSFDAVWVTATPVREGSGIILRRVDLVGESHKGVDTPHVQEFHQNRTPDGRVFPYQGQTARPTGPDDLPPMGC